MTKVVFSFDPIRRVNVRKKIQADGAWNFRGTESQHFMLREILKGISGLFLG
jgi:hypothetical protein